MRIDLHVHSDASDGTDPPGDLVRKAWALALDGAPLDGIALTDHDTIAGYHDAAAAVERLVGPPDRPFVVVPGVEISCILGDVSLHLLGYLFDSGECAACRRTGTVAHRSDQAREGDGRQTGRARRSRHLAAGQCHCRGRRSGPSPYRAGTGRRRGGARHTCCVRARLDRERRASLRREVLVDPGPRDRLGARGAGE